MIVTRTEQSTQSETAAPATIWGALDAWAQTLRPWQQHLVGTAIQTRRLTEEQIDLCFSIFLNDYRLHDGTFVYPVLSALSGRPAEPTPASFRITRISNLEDINALPSNAELTFSPSLTVIYGANGTGKSGFARLLANACFSRARPVILSDVHFGKRGTPSADISIAFGNNPENTIRFTPALDTGDLMRVAVFDAGVARKHLNDTNSFELKPSGFDVFTEMARVYKELDTRLTQTITARNMQNNFFQLFRDGDSVVSRQISSLSASTDSAPLQILASFGAIEEARLKEIENRIVDLRTYSAGLIVNRLDEAIGDFNTLSDKLTVFLRNLSDEHVTSCLSLRDDFAAKAERAKQFGIESFRTPFFTSVGTPAWEQFLAAAYALGQEEGREYPADGDHCLLCHRPLDPPSLNLIRRLWEFLTTQAREEAVIAEAAINNTVTSLDALSLERVFSEESRVFSHLTRHDPALAARVRACVAALVARRNVALRLLRGEARTLSLPPSDNVVPIILELSRVLEQEKISLTQQSAAHALASLENERILLTHRSILSEHIEGIDAFIKTQKWIRRASGDPRRALTTKHITEKETSLFAALIGSTYQTTFQKECKKLLCDLPIEFNTEGSRGQTHRFLTMRGHKPDQILSEGEQRAVALADFLTEISLNNANAGIVLDDPVNSLDHDRKRCIADRLIIEASSRQVIVFTHDIVFLSMLMDASGRPRDGHMVHWIQRDGDGRPGQVALNDSPAKTVEFLNTNKVKELLAEARRKSGTARTECIISCIGKLRRTVEEIVPQYLLKEVVRRWSDRVMIMNVKKISWDDALADEITRIYEELSAHIDAHSHPDESIGAPPDLERLSNMIGAVDDLIKRAKHDRK